VIDDQTAVKYICDSDGDKDRSKQGWAALYEHHVDWVRNLVKAKVHKNDVDDVVQEIFIKFVKTICIGRTYDTYTNAQGWLLFITRRSCLPDYWEQIKRDRGLVPFPDPDELPEDSPESEKRIKNETEQIFKDEWDETQRVLHIQLCIAEVLKQLDVDKSLKTRERTHLKNCLETLRLQIDGESIEDIAKKIERTEKATYTYLCGCRKKLMEYKPFQECSDKNAVFLVCLKNVREQLRREAKHDAYKSELLDCLQVFILKSQGLTQQEIAKKKNEHEIAQYIHECQEKLMQYPPFQQCWEMYNNF